MPDNPDKTTHVYGTLAKFKAQYPKQFLIRLGHLDDELDPPEDFTTDVDAQLTSGLQDATDEIDRYAGTVTTTPVDPAPDYFERDCYRIAVGILLEARGYDPDGADQTYIKASETTIKKYENLAAGKWTLPTTDEETGATTPATRVQTTAPDAWFTGANLDKMP